MMQTTSSMSHQPRPLGPRRLPQPPTNRAHSPLPQVNVPEPTETKPLTIRKTRPHPPGDSQLTPPSSLSSPAIPNLSVPTPRSRPATPKISLALHIPKNSDPGPDSYYGGGPRNEQVQTSDPLDIPTIMPNSDASLTTVPQVQPADPVAEVQTLIKGLEITDRQGQEDDALLDPAFMTNWSNDVLEEISRLGEGASGAVHKVKDKRTNTIMARKTITTRAAPTKQLLRELSIMSRTKHVNIIRFYGAFMSPSSSEVMILMEYSEGGSLEAVGKRIKEIGAVVGEKIAGRISEGVLQGLAYLHAIRTIHRDIKPSNILLSREGVVKLCDFGVSGELVESYVGTFTGTSLYMAPERILGHEYSIRSDVWSLGITLLELVQNKFPFPNDLPPIELMMYITSGEPPRLEDGNGVSWSTDMKDFVRQALTGDAKTRPIPKDILTHPWIVNVMKEEAHMGRWIRQVWDWKKTRRSKDEHSRGTSSRPQSSSGDSPDESSAKSDS